VPPPQPQSGRVMGIAEIRGEKNGGGWDYRIILAKHRDEQLCLNSELGLQFLSASALTAAPAYVVHRPTLDNAQLSMAAKGAN